MSPGRPRATATVAVAELSGRWKRSLPGASRLARRAAKAALAAATGEPAQVSLALADDAAVRVLNRDYRGKDKPTNVLSFESGERPFLGDVVLALETVLSEAKDQGKRPADHLTHLVVHGVLHLLGHDHETTRDAKRMERMEVEVLAGLGVPDPYEARR
ncbi:MAG: rRNA maturation RNase YbeY [Alphaproteobacteria bacterium]|nr:rRNA maturation RNase YbeY [Alphaproteobacteria bacterium]